MRRAVESKRRMAGCQPRFVSLWTVSALSALLASSLRAAGEDSVDVTKLPPPASLKVDFTQDIQPLLEARCLKCHSGEKPKSHFRLTTRQEALKGGEHGVDILPGRSAASPLIHFVSGLVPDMQMPPEGRGEPLTFQEVGLLRAWIDQELPWGPVTNAPNQSADFSPTFGWTTVRGDLTKFRELYWQREGWNGGLEQFELTDKPTPDTKITTSGHALFNDYLVTLKAEKDDLGFAHFGWSQYRKYFDGWGGYDPLFTPSAYDLNSDLHLDVGRAWADLGLTLPDLPVVVLGYEYQYRNGTEATTQWGPVGSGTDPRSIYPGFKQLSERVHLLKVDTSYEVAGVSLSDDFRGEWYSLTTHELDEDLGTNGAPAVAFTSASEQSSYFQGANSFHAEKQFTDWFFGAGGYLYSKLNADGSVSVTTLNPESLSFTALPAFGWQTTQLELERQSHVFSLSGLLGPWEGFTVSAGTQNEWSHQTGFGAADVSLAGPFFFPPTYTNFTAQLGLENLSSSLDHRVFSQEVGVRFSKIPFTTLFAEARFQQEEYGLNEDEQGGETPFLRNTDAETHMKDFRVGFNSSPWRPVSFSGQYRQYDTGTSYDNLFKANYEGYPAFFTWRDIFTREAEGKIAVQMTSWLKTSVAYQWSGSDFNATTDPVTDQSASPPLAGGITSGWPVEGGTYNSHTASLNTTLTPWRRLFLTTTFVFQNARTVTMANGNQAVTPYAGNIYSVVTSGNYALNDRTSLVAAYSFSSADFASGDAATGLPLGINYRQYTLEAGIKRQLSKKASLGLQYRFFHYEEPSEGGLSNFSAHAVFATLACKLP